MKILVPVDGSRHSQAALDFIASRNTLIGSDPQVELLNVQAPVPVRAARVVGKEVVQSYYDDEARAVFKPALARLKKAGLLAQTRLLVGAPAAMIGACARTDKADLIVMGSHGRSALKGLLLGSVTTGVLAHTDAPLLILRARAAPKGDSLKVGVALDGSKYGKRAARYLLRHRDLLGPAPQIVLLHVLPDYTGAVMPDMAGIALPAYSESEIRALQKKGFEAAVAPVRKLFGTAGLAVEDAALVGNPGDEIAAYARKKKLDLLVLGSHGYGAFKAAVMGSVATRVAAKSEVPLLLVRGN